MWSEWRSFSSPWSSEQQFAEFPEGLVWAVMNFHKCTLMLHLSWSHWSRRCHSHVIIGETSHSPGGGGSGQVAVPEGGCAVTMATVWVLGHTWVTSGGVEVSVRLQSALEIPFLGQRVCMSRHSECLSPSVALGTAPECTHLLSVIYVCFYEQRAHWWTAEPPRINSDEEHAA